eukprot:gene29088-38149_t
MATTMCRCSADATACHADSGDSLNMACPYNTCRSNILEYMSNRIYPVSYAVFALLCFQALTTLIACYTPRDGIEEILAKSGLKVSSTMTESIRIASARLSRGNRDNSEYKELATPNKSPIEKSLTYIASAIKSSFYSDKDENVARSSSSESVRYESIYTGNGLSDAPIGKNLNLAHLELGQVKHHAHQHSHSSNSVEGSVYLTGPATTAATSTSTSTSPADQKNHSVVRATGNLTSGSPTATTSTAARTSTSTSTSAVDQRFHSISRAGNLTPRSSSAATTTATSTSTVDHKYHPITDGVNLTSRGSTAATTAATSGRSFNVIPSQYERLQSLTTASPSTSHHHHHHHHYSKQEQRHHARSKNHDLL